MWSRGWISIWDIGNRTIPFPHLAIGPLGVRMFGFLPRPRTPPPAAGILRLGTCTWDPPKRGRGAPHRGGGSRETQRNRGQERTRRSGRRRRGGSACPSRRGWRTPRRTGRPPPACPSSGRTAAPPTCSPSAPPGGGGRGRGRHASTNTRERTHVRAYAHADPHTRTRQRIGSHKHHPITEQGGNHSWVTLGGGQIMSEIEGRHTTKHINGMSYRVR